MAAMVNVLLKLGEEEELVDVVLRRAARELVCLKGVEMEDLVFAFEEVRPHGRIFHDHLLRHASQVVAKVLDEAKQSAHGRSPDRKRGDRRQPERKGGPRRIRWRDFDIDADGRLSDAEIRELCQAIDDHPEYTLFRCEGERNPQTHPSFSARIRLLASRTSFIPER